MATGKTEPGANIAERLGSAEDRLTVRRCSETSEFAACVDLQKEVWQFSDIDVVPIRMFSVADKIGGQVFGCYEGNSLIGFALSIPGTRAGHPYLHSHMLAVRESYRNKGIGRRLKLAQRDDAISRGFELIEWTFDPLEIKNAYLNIEKLGAIARRYNINQYGYTSSPLQGGLPTDRLVAEWWLKSKRVSAVVDDAARPAFTPTSTIEVPAQIYEWKASENDRARAKEVQQRNRESFLAAFAQGQSVLGYELDKQGNGKFILGKWDETWSYASQS
ncbi:MAG: GCN5-related N-acetyltransferase [Acidobacteriaceae bacterium]|nr:GCN5-related N-acetyltransferase [Acidobacteriaceae bacterium]